MVTEQGRASVWIDQQIFSNLHYPDVLVSAVFALMNGLLSALRTRTDLDYPSRWLQKIAWKRRIPENRRRLLGELAAVVAELEKLKFAPLDRKIEWVVVDEQSANKRVHAGVKVELVSIGLDADKTKKLSTTATEVIEGSKEQFLERALTVFRSLITRASSDIGGGFVFIDDLYQLRRLDQPLVLGYLHRLVKDTGLWLKVGSIRYSTVTYKPGDPPRGMQVGHDAHEVPLDRGLRHFQSTQDFLEKILSKIAQRDGVNIYELLTLDALKRLVLAAGGVARDYLRLTSGAIAEARNRGVTSKPGSHRITVEDVNKAAGLLSPSKFEDLRKDEPAEAAILEALVRELTEFSRATKSAYFLIPTDAIELSDQVNKLQHLRFTHLLAESETVPNEGSRRFNIWFLDVAELSAQRATQGIDFLGWESREKRRNRRLIFTGEQADSMVADSQKPASASMPSANVTAVKRAQVASSGTEPTLF